MRAAVVIACTLAFGLGSCASYLDDLNQAEKRFVSNEHERALALLRAIEPDMSSMSHADRARYCYLRGMNDYRIGKAYRADARHWLALALAMDRHRPGSLREEWKSRAEEALTDLNQDVFGGGVSSNVDEDSTNVDGGVKGKSGNAADTDASAGEEL